MTSLVLATLIACGTPAAYVPQLWADPCTESDELRKCVCSEYMDWPLVQDAVQYDIRRCHNGGTCYLVGSALTTVYINNEWRGVWWFGDDSDWPLSPNRVYEYEVWAVLPTGTYQIVPGSANYIPWTGLQLTRVIP